MNRRKHILDMLTEFDYLDCKPAKTPIVQNHKLKKAELDKALVGSSLYQKIVGKLLYLTLFRPDICYAAHILSQFMDRPSVLHVQATHRILRYLKCSPGQGIYFPAKNNLRYLVFSHSDGGYC